MSDYMIRAMAYNGSVRAFAIRSTDLVNEACQRQDTWATASAALGRTMTISAMMGMMLKGDDKLTAKLEGDGPLGYVIADSNAHGDVRGYVKNPHVDFDLNEKGKLDVRRAVGINGSLSIVKDLGLKNHFTGQVPIVSGEVSEDFTYYFASSEQVPSAVGAGVLVNPDFTILASGGFIVQMLPDASEFTVKQLEKRLSEIKPISSLIRDGYSPEDVLDEIFPNGEWKLLSKSDVQFKCQCSKERLERAISSLGNDEIDDMIEKDGGAEATCQFCHEQYHFTVEDLERLKQ
ncbi:Hsp33 family molecular chaperone HslO [Tenuibacillus multivorans]|uniref:33 kDa chaperonin n=1 Tax=Tenuibacillus multivorans TaxID=237069 RepID=A0A1G9VYF9_9BACI|nr:Hsp33 family molecular chaperone HslO [Tenuibacillus multivorans]GEL78239.1 33 kDa chaperonin [Tenuibacillus multivorans]SDM76967.1 molecular chaperone Hsp33 [Tenuibacillus multivorans]